MQSLSRLAIYYSQQFIAASVSIGQTVRVDTTPGHVANSFIPTEAWEPASIVSTPPPPTSCSPSP